MKYTFAFAIAAIIGFAAFFAVSNKPAPQQEVCINGQPMLIGGPLGVPVRGTHECTEK